MTHILGQRSNRQHTDPLSPFRFANLAGVVAVMAQVNVWNHTLSLAHGTWHDGLWVRGSTTPTGRSVKRPLSAWVPLINGLLPVCLLAFERRPTSLLIAHPPHPPPKTQTHTLAMPRLVEVTQFTTRNFDRVCFRCEGYTICLPRTVPSSLQQTVMQGRAVLPDLKGHRLAQFPKTRANTNTKHICVGVCV